MILETVCVGPMQVNCYIVACAKGREAIIIDPGAEAPAIKTVLEKYKLKPAMVINTHGHYDHIGCNDEFGVGVYVHKQDLAMLKDAGLNFSASFSSAYIVKSEIITLEDKQIIKLDCLELETMHLPGHTPGGIALLIKSPQTGIVFTGDTLFYRGVGRTDLPGGSQLQLEKSIRERLFVLPDEVKVYPGHGKTTTIGEEKKQQPII